MQVFLGQKQAHVGVQHVFLYGAFGLQGRKFRRLPAQFLGLYVQAGGAAVPQGHGAVQAQVQAVMVFLIYKGVVVKGILDTGRNRGVMPDFCLLDIYLSLLLPKLSRFQRKALFGRLLEAGLQSPRRTGMQKCRCR